MSWDSDAFCRMMCELWRGRYVAELEDELGDTPLQLDPWGVGLVDARPVHAPSPSEEK